jgi:5'-methylthioadenosine phosphorylase
MINKKPFLGIIGGSGIYELNDIVDPEWVSIKSLYGIPSDNILLAKLMM